MAGVLLKYIYQRRKCYDIKAVSCLSEGKPISLTFPASAGFLTCRKTPRRKTFLPRKYKPDRYRTLRSALNGLRNNKRKSGIFGVADKLNIPRRCWRERELEGCNTQLWNFYRLHKCNTQYITVSSSPSSMWSPSSSKSSLFSSPLLATFWGSSLVSRVAVCAPGSASGASCEVGM